MGLFRVLFVLTALCIIGSLSQDTTGISQGCSMDVMFVLDGSGSVGSRNFDIVKTWVKSLAQGILNTTAQQTQLGVMQYSHYYAELPFANQPYMRTELQLGYRENSAFASEVDKIAYMGYTTFTAAALKFVKQNFINSKNFHNSENVQVMILLTDGRANDAANIPENAANLRKIGVIPYVVGVGQANEIELRVIATGDPTSQERVMTISRFDLLANLQVDLSKHILSCQDE